LTGAPSDYPALTREHVAGGRLFADRRDMVAVLGADHRAVCAEVGVAFGDFSEFILDTLRPTKFVAVDLFGLHQVTAAFGGRTPASVFGDLTHAEYYRRRFAARPEVVVEEGISWDVVARYPDASFDLIYLDAAHDYESVWRDAAICTQKLKADGVLVFNDYIMYDHLHQAPYGIVQTVNQLVVNDGWRVAGFALQRNMFCDIAIKRAQ
jgi:hypothetical protein